MPRSRMIKPEFWDDEKLARLSRDSRLLFVGLWTYSDDYGIVKGSHVWLKSKIFPYDNGLKNAVFAKWIDELINHGFVIPFDNNGEKYLYIKNFCKHQNVDHPSKQRNPEPPADIISRNAREDSRRSLDETETESETETENKEKKKRPRLKSAAPPLPQPSDPEFSKFIEEAVPEIKRIFDENGFSHLLENKKFYDYLLFLFWNHRSLELGTELERKLAHLRDNPPGPKSNLCLQFRNWFRLGVKLENERQREHRVGGGR